MEENQKSVDGVLENLALITDGIQTLFPEGKVICLYELNDEEFKKVQSNFRKIDEQHKKFSIDMSGLQHVFIHESVSEDIKFDDIEKIIEKPNTKRRWLKFLSLFKSGRPSI